jgi:hypothetical protein
MPRRIPPSPLRSTRCVKKVGMRASSASGIPDRIRTCGLRFRKRGWEGAPSSSDGEKAAWDQDLDEHHSQDDDGHQSLLPFSPSGELLKEAPFPSVA